MGLEQIISRAHLLEGDHLQEVPRLGQWLRHFDADFYRTHGHLSGVADLTSLSGPQLVEHFIHRGRFEGRSYSRFLHCFIDPAYYCAAYPELNLVTPADAVRHWMYEGYFEGRVPNLTTRRMLDAEFHLFQFGKVGSKAIEYALYAAGHQTLVLHVHWAADLLVNYPDCPLTYSELINANPDKPIKFITGVRDPFERAISGYLQSNFESHPRRNSQANPEEIAKDIIWSLFQRGDMDFLLRWFDHRFFRDIDVYAVEFDRRRGYNIIESGRAKIFLYRHDVLPTLEQPLADFTNLPLRLDQKNCSSDKPYAELYKRLLSIVRFTEEQVNHVLHSRMVRHFYDESAIAQMRERWTAGA
jgi:hypothetical protein